LEFVDHFLYFQLDRIFIFYIHRLCSAHQRKKSKNVSEQEKTLLPLGSSKIG